MSLEHVLQDLVIANRILADQDVVDAYGHVAVRNPNNPKTFLLSRSLAPNLVRPEDVIEHDLDGRPVDENESRPLYLERFIHAGIMKARPDVMATVHAHAEDILPFGIADGVKLEPVIHSASFIGRDVRVWDIAKTFGPNTNVLVSNAEQGEDLAKSMMDGNVALMRGHGFASCAKSLIEVVRMSVYLPRNARVLLKAKLLGGTITPLSQGEIDARNAGYGPYSTETWRAWEYWANKAGCGHLVTRPHDGSVTVPRR